MFITTRTTRFTQAEFTLRIPHFEFIFNISLKMLHLLLFWRYNMAEKYQTLDLIEIITRNDGSQYYEVANMFMNGRAELAAVRGFIKEVRILQLNIPHSNAVQDYEKYINSHYTMPTEDFTEWVEWEKSEGKIADDVKEILRANHIG